MIGTNDPFRFKLAAAARTLRGREADNFSQLIVGQASVPLESIEQFEIKSIHA